MNIAEITTYKEGGAYTHVIELVKKINANILIVTGNTHKSGYHKENGLTYFHLPLFISIWTIFFINIPGSYRRLEKLLEKHDTDLVHFHSPLFTFLVRLLQKKKVPIIMTTHYLLDIKSNKLARFFYIGFIRWMTQAIANNVEKIICVNEYYISTFTEWGIKKEKLVYIPNGVDIKKFSPGKSSVKKKFKDDKLIVYFGRLHYQKNVDLLIKSFKDIKNNISNAKLVIIGDGSDFDKLKKMSSENNDDIIMTGYLPNDDDLVDYLRAADVAVFPSRGENASFTIMEAMACELPVISSDVGNAKDILDNGRGIILEKYTEEEIVEKCIYILSNEKIANKMGKTAREFVKEKHSWNVISKKTEQLYKEIIKKNKKAV